MPKLVTEIVGGETTSIIRSEIMLCVPKASVEADLPSNTLALKFPEFWKCFMPTALILL